MSTGEQTATVETLAAVETIARALHVSGAGLKPVLEAIARIAAAAHPAATEAGIILLTGGRLVPQAVTGRPPQDLDLWQQESGQGPCLEAAATQTLISLRDTGTEPRWPGFCAAARAQGVGSMLCAPLWAGDDHLGALSLYSPKPEAFTEADVQLLRLFAALAALPLAEAQRAGQLQEALASRDLIGQAKGILMERHKISSSAAFALLTRASQALNTKLALIARHLAETGELLGPPPGDSVPARPG